METLRDIRQAYQDVGKGSSRGLCLPSLNDRGRPWGHLDLASTYCLQGTRSPCLPEPPRHRRKNQAVGSPRSSGLLSVPQSCQFSQSAPTVMEPLLQSRAHTQIRLGSDTKSNGRKGSLPVLCPSIPPRTPKLLAPLDGRPRNGGALPAFKHYAPLKPISQTSVSSMAHLRCRRLSWGSPRSGPPTARGGSEESGSSSSQSSIDLEDEDEEEEEEKDLHEQTSVDTYPKTIKDRLHFDVELSVRLKAVSYSEPREDHGVRKGNMGPHVKVINHAALTHNPVGSHNEETITHTNYGQPIKSHCENKDNVKHIEENKHINSHSKEEKNNMACAKEVMDEICHITVFDLNHDQDNAIICSDRDYRNYEQVVAQSEVCVENVKVNSSTSAVEKNRHLPPTVNLTLLQLDAQPDDMMMKPTKPSRNRERRYSKNYELPNNFQTNQSFNVLAHKNRSIPNRTPKIKGNLRTSTTTQVRKTTDLIINGEATATKVKSKLNAVKDAQQSTNRASPRKKVIELHHQNSKRPTPDKMLSSNNNTQKPERELKSARQPKRTVIAGTARSKSAVDYVTYKDMFQEIQSRDEGPAIYEMFAGPVYDNLRVSSSCEKRKDRHVQSAPSLKTRQNHRIKHKPLRKQPESNKLRRSPVEKAVISAKGKLKPVTSRAKPCLTAPPRKVTDKMEDVTRLDWHTDAELDLSEDDVEIYPNSSQVQSEDPMLSIIEEVPSTYGSEMLKPSDNLITSPVPKTGHTSHRVSHDNFSHHMQGMLKNSLDNHHKKSETENPDHPVPEPIPSQSPVQRKINTWTSGSDGRTMSPVYQKFLDEAGEGPLTDDLLRCLAEELISLDERDVSIVPCPEDYESNGKQRSQEDHAIGSEILPEDITTHGGVLSGLVVDDTITWTKGEVLGRGAYGTVYCGLTSQGQLIAVKQVCLDASDPEAADREYSRLQEEVELLKNLCHANIVGFLGTLLRQQVVSIFMEYVPGGSIASILHRFGPLPERVLSLYTSQILEGVAYLHLNRVIHRDLKGNNIMLMPTGVVKLIDFGCARRLSCVNHTSSNSGDLLKSVHGTPYWMAPEVINETGHGRKSDIWSVGCTVFEMATGKPPLAHMDKMAALFYIGAQRGSMPSLPDGFSVNARHFVQVCLTSDQKLRPSANQLLMHPFIPEDPHTKHHCSHPHGKCG